MEKKQIFIIDGHALVYRAYYAFIKNPLINSKGQPTSAVFGFANYILRLIENWSCPYITVALDSSKPTFRHELYSQYKANREEMPDDLKSQMPLIGELIEAFNLSVLKKDGLEADDLIALLTCKAKEEEFEVYIVSKDKDLMQLIGPDVKMLAPDGTGTLQMIDEKQVREKMGVGPEKIVDYLALTGDSSDNIPGVPGVGPKTAVKMLETGGSVEAILENPSILENPKLIEKIEQYREQLSVSKTLATLKCDSDLPLDLESLKRRPFDREKCLSLFRELEFSSLMRNPLLGGAPRLKPQTTIIDSIEELGKFCKRIEDCKLISIDTQTTNLLPRAAELVGISIALDEKEAFYVPVGHREGANLPLETVLNSLKTAIESPHVQKTGQNLKYDYQVLKNYGLCMAGISFDTMIAAYLLDPGKRQYDLDILAAEWLKMEVSPVKELIGKENTGKTFADVPLQKAAEYAGETVCITLALMKVLSPLLSERNCRDLFDKVELPLVTVLGDLEWHGMLIDTEFLKNLSIEYHGVLDKLTEEIYGMAGGPLNLNSPKQIGEVLFEKLSLPGSKRTKNGSHSTNVDVLEKLAPDYPVVARILEHREVQKLLSTYIDALPAQIFQGSGRVHSSFNQTVAATGRLSSTNPNLQNIPVRTDAGKRIREAFIAADDNVLLSADYSQIELRILAHLSKDPFLIDAFLADKDIHAQTASAIYGIYPEMITPEMRRAAKTINFGLMYGMGPVNLSRQLGISFNEARTFIEAYFRQFPTVKEYMESTIEKARQYGYTETLLGRRRYLPEINAKNRNIREAAERTAINTPVQGTAADIIKLAMIDIHKDLPDVCGGARMLLQVHDELVFELPEREVDTFKEWVIGKMSSAYKLSVPLKVDVGIGRNWSEAH